jgi:UDPglucose 6-dehydrogenase
VFTRRVAVVGTGYVGLTTGACLASLGHQVVCADIDTAKVERLRRGVVDIVEPGLSELVTEQVSAGRLSFVVGAATAVSAGFPGDGAGELDAEIVFLCLPTPMGVGGVADLRAVEAVVEETRGLLAPGTVVVNKSTVPVGTAGRTAELLDRPDVAVVSNPEFLREGAAIADFKHPDRIVVGAEDESARQVLREIYRPLFLNKAPILFTGRRTAELTKYAANAFLAVKISFINEIANLCEAVDADVQEVARGIGLDNRIGPKFLHPGPGYGGSCFPKDTLALLQTAKAAGVEQRIVETVVSVNDERKATMHERVVRALGGSVEGKRIGVLGLAFKPNTDDMRDAPSIPLVKALQDAGAIVAAYDPAAREQAEPLLKDVEFVGDAYGAAKDADALVIVTEWDEFRALDLDRLARTMTGKVIVDLRNVYDRADAEEAGFDYSGLGRGRVGGSHLELVENGAAR